MTYLEKLSASIRKNHSLVCVGLDPDVALMPPGVGILDFNRAIIEATAEFACAYKPNFAFYEVLGPEGMEILKQTVRSIPAAIPVIADAKRGDIGNTAKAYASAVFDYYGFDACTVNPYLGLDAIQPFLEYREKGVIVLCRTSNSGAADFQSLACLADGKAKRLFEVVAERAFAWNTYGNVGLVVGATYPSELQTIRDRYPDMPFLIPGVGAQGGDLEFVVRKGLDSRKERTVINSSRQILYASRGADFAEAAGKAARQMRDQIQTILNG